MEFIVRVNASVPFKSRPANVGIATIEAFDSTGTQIPTKVNEYETMSVYPAGESPTKVGTVNVIEINGAPENTTVHSFLDTTPGNKAAEECFAKCFTENNCDGDLADATTDGIGQIGTYTLLLVHSEAK